MSEKKKQDELYEIYEDDEILTMESATALLKSLGWSIEIDGKGDYLATIFLPDREVQFLIHDEVSKNCLKFDCGLLIMTGIFAAACQTINPYNSLALPAVHLTFVAIRTGNF
ncbi:hypothetical protein [Bartonella taylorii]|uniref:hypothetical protein n=1 Tax=Bartonella taylorii TaxID=33046 RepID=UPI001ABB8501|nr:hypothetical protein [Bartonella taylorii]